MFCSASSQHPQSGNSSALTDYQGNQTKITLGICTVNLVPSILTGTPYSFFTSQTLSRIHLTLPSSVLILYSDVIFPSANNFFTFLHCFMVSCKYGIEVKIGIRHQFLMRSFIKSFSGFIQQEETLFCQINRINNIIH